MDYSIKDYHIKALKDIGQLIWEYPLKGTLENFLTLPTKLRKEKDTIRPFAGIMIPILNLTWMYDFVKSSINDEIPYYTLITMSTNLLSGIYEGYRYLVNYEKKEAEKRLQKEKKSLQIKLF